MSCLGFDLHCYAQFCVLCLSGLSAGQSHQTVLACTNMAAVRKVFIVHSDKWYMWQRSMDEEITENIKEILHLENTDVENPEDAAREPMLFQSPPKTMKIKVKQLHDKKCSRSNQLDHGCISHSKQIQLPKVNKTNTQNKYNFQTTKCK